MTLSAGCHGYAMGYILDNGVGLPATIKYQRTEYAKRIRKDYEAGKIKERRCNMREYTVRNDGCTNTLTTVLKDNYLMVEDKRNDKTNKNNDQSTNGIS